MKPYRSLPWLEWSFGTAILLGLLSCGALLLINQFQQEAAERIAWWNQQIGTDESTTMYQGWIASVEHQQRQAAFVQTLACWGWRCSIAIAVFCWLGVLALHPRRALQMLAFVSLWIRFRWAIRRWRREALQRLGYLHLAVAIVCIGCIMVIFHFSTEDTFRLWKMWDFGYYLAALLFIIKTLLLWIAFRRLKQSEKASIIIVILNVLLIAADAVAWPCAAFIVFWSLGDTVMSFG